MEDKTILAMNHITKIYGNGIMANEDVTLSVKEGEIHALMGENGAGKSTLMKILFGIERPDGGEILLNGKPVDIANPTVALSMGIGMVHQHFMLVPSLTVAENLVLGSEPTKGIVMDYNQAVKSTEEIAQKYNLPVDPRARIKELPVGMRQRVEILKALYRGAKLLILDEPTAVLAPQETDELFRQLKNLRDQGHTIIFISHKLREIKEICDRITIMRAGRSVGVYDVSKITPEDISRMMVGRDFVEKIDKTKAKRGKVVLEVNDVSYGYGEERLSLHDVSFAVRSGEILGIAGVEGNGQRELVELISGLRQMEKGDIVFDGTNIKHESILQLRNRHMAHIPQDRPAVRRRRKKLDTRQSDCGQSSKKSVWALFEYAQIGPHVRKIDSGIRREMRGQQKHTGHAFRRKHAEGSRRARAFRGSVFPDCRPAVPRD